MTISNPCLALACPELLLRWVVKDLGVEVLVRASYARLRAEYTISTVDAVFSMIFICLFICLFIGAYIVLHLSAYILLHLIEIHRSADPAAMTDEEIHRCRYAFVMAELKDKFPKLQLKANTKRAVNAASTRALLLKLESDFAVHCALGVSS